MCLAVGERVVDDTLAHLRACGKGRRECVVLWLSRADDPGRPTAVVHPAHSSTGFGYTIEPSWTLQLFEDLARINMRVFAQVHSHPRAAFHSRTDDEFPFLATEGFVSVVVPNFGFGDPLARDWFACELVADGRWRPIAEIGVQHD